MKALLEATAHSLIRPVRRAEDALVERQRDGTGARGDLPPHIKYQVQQGCQSLPEDQMEMGESVHACGCSGQGLMIGIWGEKPPIIPSLLLSNSSFPPVQPECSTRGDAGGGPPALGRTDVAPSHAKPRSPGRLPVPILQEAAQGTAPARRSSGKKNQKNYRKHPEDSLGFCN